MRTWALRFLFITKIAMGFSKKKKEETFYFKQASRFHLCQIIISQNELVALQEYINKNIAKRFI